MRQLYKSETQQRKKQKEQQRSFAHALFARTFAAQPPHSETTRELTGAGSTRNAPHLAIINKDHSTHYASQTTVKKSHVTRF
jgi:hypothetical protein